MEGGDAVAEDRDTLAERAAERVAHHRRRARGVIVAWRSWLAKKVGDFARLAG